MELGLTHLAKADVLPQLGTGSFWKEQNSHKNVCQ